MNRLNEIEARANAATEGPWEVGDRYHCQAANMCECAPDRGPLIDTYQHPEWGTMHVHRKDEPWWNEGVLFRKAGGPPGEVARDLAAEDAEFIAHVRTDVPDMAAALRAVLELHVRAECPTCGSRDGEGNEFHKCDDDAYCEECDMEGYPCPTVTAIRHHLGDDL